MPTLKKPVECLKCYEEEGSEACVRPHHQVNPLTPPATLLIKLGSLAVHVDEYLSPGGHQFDRTVIEGLIADTEVKEWLVLMDKLAFLPKKR